MPMIGRFRFISVFIIYYFDTDILTNLTMLLTFAKLELILMTRAFVDFNPFVKKEIFIETFLLYY